MNKKPEVLRICVRCKKTFKILPSQANGGSKKNHDVGRGKYCSLKCKWKIAPLEELFWPHVIKTTGCWKWIGSTQWGTHNYGRFTQGKKVFTGHRASWIIHFGPIPKGMSVLHKCDNPPCTNPDHLFLGTQKENNLDACKKGRTPKGDNHWTRKLQKENRTFPPTKMSA